MYATCEPESPNRVTHVSLLTSKTESCIYVSVEIFCEFCFIICKRCYSTKSSFSRLLSFSNSKFFPLTAVFGGTWWWGWYHVDPSFDYLLAWFRVNISNGIVIISITTCWLLSVCSSDMILKYLMIGTTQCYFTRKNRLCRKN